MTVAAVRPEVSARPIKASILIVDDTPANLVALEVLLAPLGQRLVKAGSGQEALRRVLEEDFAAILMDVRLGDLSGIEVTGLLRQRERTRNTPVLLMTAAYVNEHELLEGYAHGAVDYLLKPIVPEMLRAKVAVFVELYLAREAMRRHEEALRAREREALEGAHREMLHHLMMQAPAAIAITRGRDFTFEFANPLYEKVMGRPVTLGRPLREVLPEVVSQPVMAVLQRVMETGEPFVGNEYAVVLDRRGDGTTEEAFFNLIYQAVRDPAGPVTGVLSFAVEVTGHVRARRQGEALAEDLRRQKEALGVSEERLRLAVDAAALGIWDFDLVSGELRWDARCKALFGLRPEQEASYEDFLARLHPEDHERTDAGVRQSLGTSGSGEYMGEFRIRATGDGGPERWLRSTGRARFEQGRAVRFTGTVQDITERKRAEEEIRRFNADLEHRVHERTVQLQEANKELESFSYSVSHDLRAPLRHITGFAQLLERRAAPSLDEVSRNYVKTITTAAQQGGTLVDDLLAFSRMGRAELRQGRVDLQALTQEVRRELEADVGTRSVEWRLGELPPVQADSALLRQVLRNLLGNALKYTRPRPHALIEVGAREAQGEVEIWVRDNGVGFEMQYVEKLFGVFQRLHTAEQFEGTGIGLANVRRIISRHGGRTWAEGAVGQGATFHFTLPRAVP